MHRSICLVLLLIWTSTFFAQESPDLETQATAIISQRCLSCHSSALKTANLVLESRESVLKGGKSGPALIPRDSERSLISRKIFEGQMPPGDPLPAAEREILRKWIDAGAPWSRSLSGSASPRARANMDWWSLQPLGKPALPDPRGLPPAWTGPIDRFIFARLQEKGLIPARMADRRTFIRRATFDLWGLPPTPEEVRSFVDDTRENAYERLIDRLLASPRYGERWGRHWLDVARFGESHGYEPNHLRERAWPYRDYVIRSFNEDKPFTQMVVEQLAGDQIAPDNPEIEAATGFLVAGIHDVVKIENIEGQLQQRANDLDDMVATTGAAFLGLTVNCARCHDHKFDPISQADYYRMQAMFAGVQHAERELCTPREKEERKNLERPILQGLEEVNKRLAATRDAAEPRIIQRREEIARKMRLPVDAKGNEEVFNSVVARFVRMNILATSQNQEPALDEIEIWSNSSPPVNVAAASRGTKATARSTRKDGSNTSFYKPEYLNDGKPDETWISGEPNTGQFMLEFPRQETISRITWSRDRLGANQERFSGRIPLQYEFEASRDGAHWEKIASSDDRLPYTDQARQEFFLLAVLSPGEKAEFLSLQQQKKALEKDLADLPELPKAYIGKFVQPTEPTFLLKRGNPMDKGEEISPGGLSTLSRMMAPFHLQSDAPEGARRLALANWLVDERNALLARVLANRLWHYHFGRGLVGTPSDFGFNGEKPTHPELLEWLASRLQASGWRLKAFHRELMLSAAYRQSSETNENAAAQDQDDRYLWRFPPTRLDAEAIRDSILRVSGKLDLKMGGPGFQLFTYRVDNVATYGLREAFDDSTYRRAVYSQSARSVKDDVLGPFDCPDTTAPEPKRVVTTTALQALSLLNGSFVVDQAHFLAARLIREAGNDPHDQVKLAFQLCFGRSPTEVETSSSVALIHKHGLWLLCRTLMNANEFLYIM